MFLVTSYITEAESHCEVAIFGLLNVNIQYIVTVHHFLIRNLYV